MTGAATDSITLAAHAKVNLFLRVLARESDGFHGIETLFCRLDLADSLTARRTDSSGVTLVVDGSDTGPVEQNLAVRAARAVQAAVRQPAGVHLTLTKRIPAGAGLGGGSADAAAALIRPGVTGDALGTPGRTARRDGASPRICECPPRQSFAELRCNFCEPWYSAPRFRTAEA